MEALDAAEDVAENYLYRALRRAHPDLLAQLERRGGLVCCPPNALLRGLKITPRFLEAHVLFPSEMLPRYYKTAYRNAGSGCGSDAREDDDGHVVVVDGTAALHPPLPPLYLGDHKAKILSQEEFYVDDKSYRVALIDSCLADAERADVDDKDDGELVMPQRPTLQQCAEFLSGSPVNEVVLAKVRDHQRQFVQSYLFVRGFEAHAARRVRDMVQRATDDLVCANADYRRASRSPRQLLQLSLIVASFVVGSINDKVWKGLCHCFAPEDEKLAARAASMALLDPVAQLGVSPALLAGSRRASEALRALPGDAQTPVELLYRVRDAIELIVPDAPRPAQQQQQAVVAGDDLLPALVWALATGTPQRLYTMTFYVEQFVTVAVGHTALGYASATLRAAVEYINAHELEEDKRREIEARHRHARHVSEMPRSSASLLHSSSTPSRLQSPPLRAPPSTAAAAAPAASPPTMRAPPKTASAAGLPGAAASFRVPEVIDLRSPESERKMGAFLTALRDSEGSFSKADLLASRR
eukprot:m51a1_g10691 hypothetical protein (527) ;mRNA; r:131058-133330